MANPMRASERFFTISSHYVNASERRDFSQVILLA
jgi:hypothetical protein